MTLQFQDLEVLAQQKIELNPTAALVANKEQYQDAALEEILEGLESVTEVFVALAAKLPAQLKQSARQEIKFFAYLYHQRLMEVLQYQNS